MINTLVLAAGLAATPPAACARSFEDVVTRHFAAIEGRDLQAYMSTIGPEGDLMILPDGTIWRSRSAIQEGHREWFADPTWTFEHEPVHQVEGVGFGLVARRVQVVRPDRTSPPFLLSILFARELDGCWYLRHDQNTVLAAPEG